MANKTWENMTMGEKEASLQDTRDRLEDHEYKSAIAYEASLRERRRADNKRRIKIIVERVLELRAQSK